MVIKGSPRGRNSKDASLLARHLLADENEVVEVIETEGVASTDLSEALQEMRLLAAGTRARHALYHASTNLDRREAMTMTDRKWTECANELGKHLGLDKRPRVVIKHVKHGREHIHVVFSRVDPLTLRVARTSHNYRAHERCSRILEKRFGLRPVTGAFSRPRHSSRPVATATHADWQAQERTGVQVQDVAKSLKRAWEGSHDGGTFERAIHAEGLSLAKGRRGIVVVDQAGTPHSLPRRLGLKIGEVRNRLVDIEMRSLPTVEAVKGTVSRRQQGRGQRMKKTFIAVQNGNLRQDGNESMTLLERLEYWRSLGFKAASAEGLLTIFLPSGTQIEDRGDGLSLLREGEPSDEEISILVGAARARGWKGIRFSGGSPEFQRRARLEALKQGWALEDISLECEDKQSRPVNVMPMPEHIKDRFFPSAPEDKAIESNAPVPPADAPATAPEFRP